MSFFNHHIHIFAILFCLQATTSLAEAADYPDILDDWVCTKNTTCNNLCDGYYVEPPAPFPGQPMSKLVSKPITITADSAVLATEGSTTLTGHVRLNQGNRFITADKAILYKEAAQSEIENIKGYGNIRLTEPGFRIQGSFAEFKTKEDTQYLENTAYRLYALHARGTANSILVKNRSEIELNQASYTTCAPQQNLWLLKAKKIKLNKITGRGKSYHTRLYFKNIPLFYAPYWNFPIDDRRQTGFLYPSYDKTKTSGFILSAPFYWNVAPNYDVLLTPRYFSKRGAAMDGLLRYLTPYSTGEISASILPKDKAYRAFQRQYQLNHSPLTHQDSRVIALKKNATRRSLRLLNHTKFNPNFNFNLQYFTVWDDNYLADFNNISNMGNTTQLLQQGDLVYQDSTWHGLLRLQRYQTLHPYFAPPTYEVYRKLPQIAFQNELPFLNERLLFTSTGEFTHFTQPTDRLSGLRPTIGNRLQLRPTVSMPIISSGWFLNPRCQLDFLGYSLQLTKKEPFLHLPNRVSRMIPMFDLDSGLIFERNLCINEIAFLQTLEPRAYYLYVPYHDQNNLPNFDTTTMGFDMNQLYRDNRFTGLDRVGDANQITLGLTSRFLETANGQERLNMTLGQIYYFQNRRVTFYNPTSRSLSSTYTQYVMNTQNQKFSPITAEAIYRLQPIWTFSAGQQWDPHKTRSNQTLFGMQYHPDPLNVINLRYIFINKNFARIDPKTGSLEHLKQSDLSIARRLTDQWRILGRWRYDLYKKRSAQQLVGIEHQGCCTALRLSFYRYLQLNDTTIAQDKRYETGIFLQFVLKGLGGVGHNQMSQTLRDAIPGYEWREHRF